MNMEQPVESPVAAPVVDPAPAPVVADGMQQYDPNSLITVPKDQLAPWDGRYGDALRDAHQYQQAQQSGVLDDGVADFVALAKQNGMTTREAFDYISSQGQQQPQVPANSYGQPAAQPALSPNEQPLTEARFNELRAEDRAAADAARDADKNSGLMRAEFEDTATTLRGIGFNITDDGHPADSNATNAQRMFNGALNDVMKQDIPDWYSADERKAALDSLSNTPSTAAQRQRAVTLFQEQLTDFRQQAISEFSQAQESVPAGSLGDGPGGPPQKNTADMTEKEIEENVMNAVAARTGPPVQIR